MNKKRMLVAKRQFYKFLNEVCDVADKPSGTKVSKEFMAIRNQMRKTMEKITDGTMPNRRRAWQRVFGAYLMDNESEIIPRQIMVSRGQHDDVASTTLELRFGVAYSSDKFNTTIKNIYLRMKEAGVFKVELTAVNEITIKFRLSDLKIDLPTREPKPQCPRVVNVIDVGTASISDLEAQIKAIQIEIDRRNSVTLSSLLELYKEERNKLLDQKNAIIRYVRESGVKFDMRELHEYQV